jgi:hypothetical protein
MTMKGFVKAAAENPATTALGILVLLNVATEAGIAILDCDPTTVPNWGMVVQAAIGLAMVVAKDGWKFWKKPKDE